MWRVEAFKVLASPDLSDIPQPENRWLVGDYEDEQDANDMARWYAAGKSPEFRTIVTDLGEVETPED